MVAAEGGHDGGDGGSAPHEANGAPCVRGHASESVVRLKATDVGEEEVSSIAHATSTSAPAFAEFPSVMNTSAGRFGFTNAERMQKDAPMESPRGMRESHEASASSVSPEGPSAEPRKRGGSAPVLGQEKDEEEAG